MIKENINEYKRLLKQYIAFKSISTDKKFKSEMDKTVSWLSKLLKANKFKVKILKGPNTNPVVFAEYIASKNFETVLIYGHYDIQPAEHKDGWTKDPFILFENKGKLFARGVVDNKGQNLIHIFTVINLIKENALGYNIKFLIEGNEETANLDMEDIIKKNKKLLKSDYIMISDGEIVGNTPTIEASLRGGFNMTATIRTASNHLHSGLCGGAVPSASHEMAKLLALMFDDKNKISIPDFYDGVDKITDSHRANSSWVNERELCKLFGVKTLLCEDGQDFHMQTGLRPTMQVSGLKSGYIDEGYCNIVPSVSEARINVRLVASQDPKKIFESIKKFIRNSVPKYADIAMEADYLKEAIKINIDSEKAREVTKILKYVYKKTPIIKYVGGGIPIVSHFKDLLNIDTLLVSLGNDDCNMHGVNENFTIDLVKKGLAFSDKFFRKK